MNYYDKYIKYKIKYIGLKKNLYNKSLKGGSNPSEILPKSDESTPKKKFKLLDSSNISNFQTHGLIQYNMESSTPFVSPLDQNTKRKITIMNEDYEKKNYTRHL